MKQDCSCSCQHTLSHLPASSPLIIHTEQEPKTTSFSTRTPFQNGKRNVGRTAGVTLKNLNHITTPTNPVRWNGNSFNLKCCTTGAHLPCTATAGTSKMWHQKGRDATTKKRGHTTHHYQPCPVAVTRTGELLHSAVWYAVGWKVKEPSYMSSDTLTISANCNYQPTLEIRNAAGSAEVAGCHRVPWLPPLKC